MTQDKQEPRNPYPKLDVPYGTQYDGWQKCYSTMKPQIETLRAEIKATDIAHGEALEEIDRIEAENARLKEENKRLDIMLNVHDTALEAQLKECQVQERQRIVEVLNNKEWFGKKLSPNERTTCLNWLRDDSGKALAAPQKEDNNV